MMEQEVLDLKIKYFDEDRLKKDLSVKNKIPYWPSPYDRSWGAYFTSKLVERVLIIDTIYIDGNLFYILDDDILWFEAIPTYKNGEFEWVRSEYSSLYSIKDMLRRDKSFGLEDPFYTKNEYENLFIMLNRNDKLKQILS